MCAPTRVGRNTTFTCPDTPSANDGGVSPEIENALASVPATAKPAKVSSAVPRLSSVNVRSTLPPGATSPKSSEAGCTSSSGTAGFAAGPHEAASTTTTAPTHA